MELLAVAVDSDLDGLQVDDPQGHPIDAPAIRAGGPPWSLRTGLDQAVAGTYRVTARRGDEIVACREVQVGGPAAEFGRAAWDLPTQALFAVWVEHLFDAPPDQPLNFASLEPVLRDPQRNFLYDYLRPGEDQRVPATPDCGDLAYFLRAYFAWKIGLPIAFRHCDRGSASRPPQCGPSAIDTSLTAAPATVEDFRVLSRRIIDRVHSGSARTALHEDASDFYPLPLERAALWPGSVFADPYGHTLILVKWVPQTAENNGLLLAVDAQPDNSVARKRFWEGNFLFAHTPSAGPGFKVYRVPLEGEGKNTWLQPSNAELTALSIQPPLSLEQADLAPADFYARMEQLINPQGLDPQAAYLATLAALMEQLEARVRSVNNGEAYLRNHPGTVIPMPSGAAIFETIGPWEDYSTPSRDMRLLIAMQVLADLPERIRRHPELYLLHGDSADTAAAGIEALHWQSLETHFISYSRSDGSPWSLSLGDIYQRRAQLEMAYNPNDCVERRWGATPDSPDYATCKRRAPADQRARMEEYRPWFREMRRPPR
ncbi:hypothetical protein [Geoalkalibacter halelectricus]|uniref:Uncharacterized protein n=1 Tax=Geoalkalibacter halelectricus TaxID=2847045 RepID=A0ABY5ZJW3_9BACT|nr:hypothetical protein [Geoalkalibacter halelectricus]MDO3378275.1 hypothetical protein [Geoalkalibacter halelectricus]UWZ79134.1 hypothetical protein L9S41_15830 [Geoalkalibacter halelectricus]